MPARHRLGNLDLLLLSDGEYYQDAGAVFGIVPRVLWERLGIELNDRYQMALGLNSMLVSSQGKTILIETGVGEKERPLGQQTPLAGGTLLDDLRAAGVAPEDVDIVINTHLHADHCGWNTRKGSRRLVRADVPSCPVPDPARRVGGGDAPQRAHARDVPSRRTCVPLEAAGQLELIDGETQRHRRDHHHPDARAHGGSRQRRACVGRRERRSISAT